jgi:two-component system, chemotaxis family, chemotaxis protein CheY
MKLPEDLTKKHFLVCDDEKSMRELIVSSLHSLGVSQISEAASGSAGYQLILGNIISGTHINFVITDLLMEEGNGIDLTRMIRSNQMTKHIPVLMITSKAEINHVMEAIKAGAQNYLLKPWSIDDLQKKLIEIDKKHK